MYNLSNIHEICLNKSKIEEYRANWSQKLGLCKPRVFVLSYPILYTKFVSLSAIRFFFFFVVVVVVVVCCWTDLEK